MTVTQYISRCSTPHDRVALRNCVQNIALTHWQGGVGQVCPYPAAAHQASDMVGANVALQTSPLPAVHATCFAAAGIFIFCIWSSLTDMEETAAWLVRADALLAGDILVFPNPESSPAGPGG